MHASSARVVTSIAMGRTGRHEVAEALRERINSGLHVGQLAGGERLPAARKLAVEYGVNERVILAAFKILADDGLLELRPRSGAYVRGPHHADGGTLPGVAEWVVRVLLEGRARGFAPRKLASYLRRCMEAHPVRAACIECNDDQRHLLCSELSDDHGFVTEGVDAATLRNSATLAALQHADVLITTVFHSAEVQKAAEKLAKPWIAVQLRETVISEVARRLRSGPVYYIATDPRFEPKLRRMLAPLGSTEHLRVLLVHRDNLDEVPDDAPTFVMTSAQEQLARHSMRAPGRHIQPQRQFSDESARELLSFLIRSNLNLRATR